MSTTAEPDKSLEALYEEKRVEYAKLTDAKLAKKIRHLDRTIVRGIRTGFLHRTLVMLQTFLRIAVEEADQRRIATGKSS